MPEHSDYDDAMEENAPDEPSSRDIVIWLVAAFLVMAGLVGALLLLFQEELRPWTSELLYPTGRMIRILTQSRDASERREATQHLIEQEDPETVQLLVAAAKRSRYAREGLETMRSEYLAELRSGNGNARVVICLGEISDEEVRAALEQALRRDRYPPVREAAAMTLGEAPRSKHVLDALLYAVTRDLEPTVKSAALVSLDQLEATMPVRSTLEVARVAVVVNNAGWTDGAIAGKHIVMRNVAPLAKINDFKMVARVYSELVELGIPQTESILIDALWGGVGTPRMAQDFINSGNERLRVAGEEWAQAEGYKVNMGTLPGGSRWGGF